MMKPIIFSFLIAKAMKFTCKPFILLACATMSLGAYAQTVQSLTPASQTSPSSEPEAPRKLGSQALGAMDSRATHAIESVGRTNSNVMAMAAGAGAAVAPQSGATAMQGSLSTPSILAIGLAGLALGGGGGGGGSTGTR